MWKKKSCSGMELALGPSPGGTAVAFAWQAPKGSENGLI